MNPIDKNVLVDSGYFFALMNRRDAHHEEAVASRKWLDKLRIVLPWPILYESLNTRFMRKSAWVREFEGIMDRAELIDDRPYRDRILDAAFTNTGFRAELSLVDRVIMEVAQDKNVRVRAMLTFNHRDFAVFCAHNRIEYLCPSSGR